MSDNLPPLPKAGAPNIWGGCYTADQMRSYAAAAVASERERCARIADKHATRDYPWGSENTCCYHAQAHWAERIAAAIRGKT